MFLGFVFGVFIGAMVGLFVGWRDGYDHVRAVLDTLAMTRDELGRTRHELCKCRQGYQTNRITSFFNSDEE